MYTRLMPPPKWARGSPSPNLLLDILFRVDIRELVPASVAGTAVPGRAVRKPRIPTVVRTVVSIHDQENLIGFTGLQAEEIAGPLVPEPATFIIWALGLLELAAYARRRRNK